MEPTTEQLEQEFGITIHNQDTATNTNTTTTTTNPPRPNPWLYAGPSSTFPNLTPPTDLNPHLSCKLFSTATATTPSSAALLTAVPQADDSAADILIFRYRGVLHAISHACPHQGYPMSRASVSDIEDFGVVLSAGVTCPSHGWTFDLFTGEADTGRYRLGIWEVDVRRGLGEGEGEEEEGEEGVWVRRREKKKKRMG